MSRILLMVSAALLICGALFAQTGAGDVVVQAVNGIARYEAAAGRLEPLTVNQRISRDTVINTGLNSSLVLKVGDEVFTIRALQRGTVAILTSAGTATRPGLSLGASVVEDDEVSGRARSNISTASTRAAETAEDIEWAEDFDE